MEPAGEMSRFLIIEGGRIQLFNDLEVRDILSDVPDKLPEPLRKWLAIRSVYSNTTLTKAQDILVALSAIARETQRQLDCPYYAGIFEKNALTQLCWAGNPDKEKRLHERNGEAPSWSWASIRYWTEGFFCHDGAIVLAEYKCCQVELRDGDVFGRVIGGSMQVDGMLLPLEVSDSCGLCIIHLSSGSAKVSSELYLHPDLREMPTAGVYIMPLFLKDGVICGLALREVGPSVYSRVAFVSGYLERDEAANEDLINGLTQTCNPDGRGIVANRSRWQQISMV
jgi:hypothetical protein